MPPAPTRDGPPTFVTRGGGGDDGSPNPGATAAIVLGIAGLVVLVLSIGLLFIAALPLSVAAWVVGTRARSRADRGEAGQRGQANAGAILGMVGTALGVLATVGWTLVFALADDLVEDIERELEELEDETRDDDERDEPSPEQDRDRRFVRLGLAAMAVAGRASGAL